jgi:hypothetical protein
MALTSTATDELAPSRTWTPARVVGLGFGAVYLLVGVVGALVTGWDHLTSLHGQTLLIFQVNPLHNIAHLGLGAALLVGALLGTDVAVGTNRLVGGVFFLLGLVGPFLMGTSMNMVAVNSWDHVLHFGTAAVLLGYPLLTRVMDRRTS